MNGASGEMRFYVRYNDSYDIINEVHIATDRGDRNRMARAVNRKYKKMLVLRL